MVNCDKCGKKLTIFTSKTWNADKTKAMCIPCYETYKNIILNKKAEEIENKYKNKEKDLIEQIKRLQIQLKQENKKRIEVESKLKKIKQRYKINKETDIEKKKEKPKKIIKKVTKKKQLENEEILLNQGIKLFNDGNNKEALTNFEKIIKQNFNNTIAWKYRGNALYKLGGMDAKALECFNIYLKKYPNDIDILRLKGFTLEKLKQNKEAEKCFSKITQLQHKEKSNKEQKTEQVKQIFIRKCINCGLKFETDIMDDIICPKCRKNKTTNTITSDIKRNPFKESTKYKLNKSTNLSDIFD